MATSRADLKTNLRARLRAQREERYVEHNLLHLLKLPEISQAEVIASYYSYGTEPSTLELNQAILEVGKRLLLPRINGKDIEWVQWNGSAETLQENGKFHEPVGEALSALDSIDLVLVPALAIDPDGFRLGQGGGFYDRALPQLRAWKHGIVYNYERMEHDLPREPWDVPMDSW
ncbi:MAG: 5-formyltetrahydrofolate cyclo-ligase [Candidatus Planktophila sp.]|nr:5-formyltetrahydrofolate cyclo-ligase [Candidatus Planktophila sp.]